MQVTQIQEEKEESLQLIEIIFYSSERIICLDIADLPCGNSISAELSTCVSSLYSAVSEHARKIISQIHSTAGNVQEVPGLPCSDWTRIFGEKKNQTTSIP